MKKMFIVSLLCATGVVTAQDLPKNIQRGLIENRHLSLADTAQLFLIQYMLAQADYQQKFCSANITQENKDIAQIVDFIRCTSSFSHDAEQDINFLKTALAPYAIDDLKIALESNFGFTGDNSKKSIEKQIELVTCINTALKSITSSSALLRILLIALAMPSMQVYYRDSQVSTQAMVDQLLSYIVAQNELSTLYYAVRGYDLLTVLITKRLTDIYLEKIDSFSDLIDYYHPEFFDVRQTSAFNAAQLQQRKDLFYDRIKDFYDLVAANQHAAHDIIAYLIKSGPYNADTMKLLSVLFSKGFTPHVMIDGSLTFDYLFDKNYEKLFSTEHQVHSIMPFILFLIEHGLDVRGSQPKKDSASVTNLHNLIQNYPQYKDQLENAQSIYQEKKSKFITSRNS